MKTKMTMKLLRRWDAFLQWLHKYLKAHGVKLCDGMYGVCFRKGSKHRQNTAYNEDKRNWVFMCPRCREANHEYWKEMWKEYYGGVL
jgi:hypothetical protein